MATGNNGQRGRKRGPYQARAYAGEQRRCACLDCVNDYTPKRADQRYCSNACRVRANRLGARRECRVCGRSYVPAGREDLHCSQSCADLAALNLQARVTLSAVETQLAARGYVVTVARTPAYGSIVACGVRADSILAVAAQPVSIPLPAGATHAAWRTLNGSTEWSKPPE